MNSDFRETLYTVDKQGRRKWVYATILRGFFYKRRQLVAYILMIVYLSMPWLKAGGKQAVLLDIPARRFLFFGAEFWATDTTFLVMLLGFLAICLFFFTALIGRVWCGWACPETIFLEFLFRPLEELIEGSAAKRHRLDQQPWNSEKIIKKAVKYILFAFLSWIVASTFLAYFVWAEKLIWMTTSSPFENPFPFMVMVFVVGAMMFQFGWFREQFCTIVCPYARFQSVLMDQNSLTVGYDAQRGEPRGKLEKKEKTLGDCIDCGLCVRVCPTGIDIRNGLQLECISCANCVDACDSVMTKIGRSIGLIRYDTEARLKGEKGHWLRPRVIVYALILLTYISIFTYRLATRSLSEFELVRGAKDVPFSIMPSGLISNHMHLVISNKSESTHVYSIVVMQGDIKAVLPINPFPVPAKQIVTVPVFFEFDKQILKDGKLKIGVKFNGDDGSEELEETTILGPG